MTDSHLCQNEPLGMLISNACAFNCAPLRVCASGSKRNGIPLVPFKKTHQHLSQSSPPSAVPATIQRILNDMDNCGKNINETPPPNYGRVFLTWHKYRVLKTNSRSCDCCGKMMEKHQLDLGDKFSLEL